MIILDYIAAIIPCLVVALVVLEILTDGFEDWGIPFRFCPWCGKERPKRDVSISSTTNEASKMDTQP
jgi:hypothetical protein